MYDDEEGILACTRAEKPRDGASSLWEGREGPAKDMTMGTGLSWISMVEVEEAVDGWAVTQRWVPDGKDGGLDLASREDAAGSLGDLGGQVRCRFTDGQVRTLSSGSMHHITLRPRNDEFGGMCRATEWPFVSSRLYCFIVS